MLPTAVINLDPAAGDPAQPLYRRLYDQLREMILDGRLVAGTRLPASRTLAGDLGLSRNTVSLAFEQLVAEGYLSTRQGAGTYVSSALPEAEGPLPAAPRRGRGRRPTLSRRGRALSEIDRPRGRDTVPFAAGQPALDAFPFALWARLLSRSWRAPAERLAAVGEPGGYAPLRTAIANYLGTARGVLCAPEQVIVVSGAQQAIHLTAQVLLDPGDAVLVEEPGYAGIRGALAAAGATPVPVDVDAQGLAIGQGARATPSARMVCVAPSHQHPLGVVMSLPRRLETLDWAEAHDAWVLEDDYDSEYRYAGRPLAALQGLDRSERVIYVGSFSKVMYPTLRLGYLVVPVSLVTPFLAARAVLDDHASMLAQPALAQFIAEGHFASHLRRMRALYAARQQALLAAAADDLDGLLHLTPDEAGMHLLAELAPPLARRLDDRAAAAQATAAGIIAVPLSAFYAGPARRQGLVLGYAGFDAARLGDAVRGLRMALTA